MKRRQLVPKVLFVGFCVAVVGACLWELRPTPPPVHAVLPIDRSLSVRLDCDAVVAAGKALAETKLGPGSTLSLLSMGASAATPRPLFLFDKAVPVQPDATIIGRDDAAFAAEQAAYFKDLRTACLSAPQTRQSPVLRMVKDAVAHLRSKGCKPEGECDINSATDLEDDVDEKLAPVIARLVAEPNMALPKDLAGSIDNRGIRISFCFPAQTPRSMKNRAPSPEAIERIWAGMFSRADIVSFAPSCGNR